MRLIDADAMKLDLESEKKDTYENGMYSVSNGLGIALTCVEDQPTIDAVPVVRCKDCKRVLKYEDGVWCCATLHPTKLDGFCHRGEERKWVQ